MKPGRPSGLYTQTARVRRLLNVLWTHDGLSVGDLGRELDVTPRTVRRDIAALREAGFGVGCVNGRVSITREGIAADPAVRAVARHLRAEITRSVREGEPDVVRHTLAEIADGIERGEIGLVVAQPAEGGEVACG